MCLLFSNRGFEMEGMYEYNANTVQPKFGFEEFDEGPAPIEDTDGLKKATSKSTYGTLDSDVEELEFEDHRAMTGSVRRLSKPRLSISKDGSSLASCRALIIYFSKLAKTNNDNEDVDLNFVEALLQSGADINFSDRHGQTIMHEISRAWHPDVALFAIQHYANVNKSDLYGRTPLHLAAAVDYVEMVVFLVASRLGVPIYSKDNNYSEKSNNNNKKSWFPLARPLSYYISFTPLMKCTALDNSHSNEAVIIYLFRTMQSQILGQIGIFA